MTTKAILFDMGGVLLQWSPLALYQKHFPHIPRAEIETFFREVDFTAWNLQQDKGRSFDEGVRELSARFPHRAELIRAYHDHWPDCISGPIHGTEAMLQRLKRDGLGLYGLTNFSTEKFALTRQMFPFISLLDDVIVSGDVKLVKPDPAIYALTLARIGCAAPECVFVDDSLHNITAAREFGFVCIHFQSPEQLETELRELNLL
jgi:2-haloacid dehalogenase